MPPATPADVLAQRRHLILSGDADGFADLFAPDAVIAEMRTKGTVTTTGRSFTAASVQVLRIREGHIVLFRDFVDPRVLADLTGEPHAGS